MIDYSKLKKGSKIEEYNYGLTIRATIVSYVTSIEGKYYFEAMTDTGNIIHYVVGEMFSPNINVVEY